MTLSWSRALYLDSFSIAMENFLRGHVNAFASFHGSARVLLYDNLLATSHCTGPAWVVVATYRAGDRCNGGAVAEQVSRATAQFRDQVSPDPHHVAAEIQLLRDQFAVRFAETRRPAARLSGRNVVFLEVNGGELTLQICPCRYTTSRIEEP
jgi:hypothetical protein